MSTFERYGALAVSLSATFSFFSTLSLGLFIAYLSVRYRRHATEDIPLGSGLRFLRSQAGYLFMQLLFADWIQALGFGLSWVWYGRPAGIADPSTTCTVQALAIEAGDVASALFSLFIAVHTAAFLACQYRPPKVVLNLVCWAAWIFVALVTALGPLAIERMEQKGSFYATAGNWCWISKSYEDSRLWLHYLFIFASAIGQLIAYCAVFIILRFRIPMRVPRRLLLEDRRDSTFMLDRKYPSPGGGSGLAISALSPPAGISGRPAYLASSSPSPSPLATPTRSTFADRSSYLQPPAAAFASPLSPSMSVSASPASTTITSAATGRGYIPPPQHRPTTSSSTLRRKIDRSSLVMLAFPLVNLAVILPLSVYRLSALAGRQGSPQALAVCGFIFALGGFANCTMYCLTRKLIRFPSNAENLRKEQAATPLAGMFVDSEKLRTPNDSPGSDTTKVDNISVHGAGKTAASPFSSLAAAKLKELRLCPTSSTGSSAGSIGRASIESAIDVPVPRAGRVPKVAAAAAALLLPPASIGRKGSKNNGAASRPSSRGTLTDVSAVNVSRETVTRTDM